MANKILIPLQSLISCFLELPVNEQHWVQLRDSGRGYSPVCPEGSSILFTLVITVAQVGGKGSSALISFVPRIRPMKTEAQVRQLAVFRAGYEGSSSAQSSHCFFLPSFMSSLLRLEPGQNPWCLVLRPNEAQALDVSLQKNSVIDTVRGKRWICSDLERSTLNRV